MSRGQAHRFDVGEHLGQMFFQHLATGRHSGVPDAAEMGERLHFADGHMRRSQPQQEGDPVHVGSCVTALTTSMRMESRSFRPIHFAETSLKHGGCRNLIGKADLAVAHFWLPGFDNAPFRELFVFDD
jgi:hypothetical protein